MRTTLGDIRYKTRIPDALVLCASKRSLKDYVNEAQEILLMHGLWWGTYTRWTICAINGCLTLPPQLASVERAAVCHNVIPVHDLWFDFLDNGWGTGGSDTGCGVNGNCGGAPGMNYKGNFPSFDDIRGVNKQLNVICDLASDVGKEVTLLGYDENNNWIRTEQGGEFLDGEVVVLAQSNGTLTTKLFSSLTDVKPPDDLDGQWWLYEFNTGDSTKRMIGQYQYWEKRPSYPRYQIPGLCSGATEDGDCRKTLVEVLAKLEFIPVEKDSDYLIIGNRTALKEACLSVKAAEPPADIPKSEMHLRRALRALDLELNVHLGSGRQIGINFQGTGMNAAGPVEAFL